MSEPAVIVTFIRHGESKDNLRGVWAGWTDAPLSELGEEQARALGKSLADVPFEHIYASDLKRATMTAQAVHAGQAANPKPPLTRTAAIREQHWGIAEGKPWVMHTTPGKSIEQHFAEGIYPVLFGPEEKFPNGESKVDLGKRATQAVKQLVIPHVYQVARTGERRVHIAVVSHGLCISELVPALLKWGPYVKDEDFSGLKNTAWTRVEVALKDGKKGELLSFTESDPPLLDVKVTHKNIHGHLQNVKQVSSLEDPNQMDAKSFFGGGGIVGDKPLVKEHAKSNVEDQPGKAVSQGNL